MALMTLLKPSLSNQTAKSSWREWCGEAPTLKVGPLALARYNADGSLDGGFGSGGKVTTAFGPYDDGAQGMTLQADGKIVAVGFAEVTGAGYRFGVARYNTDGSLDTTFGSGGKVTTDMANSFGFRSSHAAGVAVQADGKIVVVGNAYLTSGLGVSRARTL